MKYLMVLLWVAGLFSSAKSQAQSKGDIRGSLAAVYGTDVATAGINVGGEYLFSDKISAAPSFSIFFVDPGSFTSLNLDGRYYFSEDSHIQFYGLFGIAVEKAKVEFSALGNSFSASDSEAGLNVGAGLMIHLTGKAAGNLQLKIATPGDVQLTLQGGIAITF